MTEEERQKTILELEQQVFFNTKPNEIKKCEVCGDKLISGDCPDHPSHIRMHHQYLMRMRKINER